MQVSVAFTDQPIRAQAAEDPEGAGSVVEFRGVVRGRENGAAISALEYEIFPSMADKVIREILDELGRVFPCLRVTVIHRFGVIPVGETAIFLRVESSHRTEGFRLLEEFMNRLKQDVPIWKTGSRSW